MKVKYKNFQWNIILIYFVFLLIQNISSSNQNNFLGNINLKRKLKNFDNLFSHEYFLNIEKEFFPIKFIIS